MKIHRTPPVRFQPASAFTLIELLLVVAIIALLAALSMGTFQYAQQQASRNRTTATLSAITGGLERYKADNGEYPAPASPGQQGSVGGMSVDVSGALMLYQALTGDGDDKIDLQTHANGASDGIMSDTERPHVINADYVPVQDAVTKTWRSKLGATMVTSDGFMIVDGFGHPFFYQKAVTDPAAAAITINPTYDVWSVAQRAADASITNLAGRKDATKTAAWIKNW